MKILVTKEQLDVIRENDSKEFNCDKCDHSWKIKKEDKHPYLCHICGYDSHKKTHNYDELENFWKNYKKEGEVTEKWSEKYKKSIDCSHPKGFSQRAHCQGRKKHVKHKLNENIDDALKHYGFDIQGIKFALKVMSELSNTYGEQIPLIFSLNDYELKRLEYSSKPILSLLIDVNTEDGETYNLKQINRHEITVELLHVLEMLGLYNDEKMYPYYQFHFNVT
jgi:uncharacterized protein Smg (DUF494 family)